MSSKKYTQAIQNPVKIWNIAIVQKVPLYYFPVNPVSFSCNNFSYFFSTIVLLFLELHMYGIIHYNMLLHKAFFTQCDFFFFRFTHVCISNSFLFIAEQYSIVYILPLFLYYLIVGYLGCFQFLLL